MKNYLGECNLKVTRPNGEWSEILVSNPVKVRMLICSAAFTKENALMTVCLSCLSDPCDFKFLRMSHLIFMYRSDRCPAVDRVDLGVHRGWVGGGDQSNPLGSEF